jgi:hypothetical protein
LKSKTVTLINPAFSNANLSSEEGMRKLASPSRAPSASFSCHLTIEQSFGRLSSSETGAKVMSLASSQPPGLRHLFRKVSEETILMLLGYEEEQTCSFHSRRNSNL